MALNREQLKAKAASTERQFDIVSLPTGGDVKIQSLTRSEQRKWRKACQKKNGEADPAKQNYFDDVLLSMTVVADNGEAVFTVTDAFSGCWDDFLVVDTNALIRGVTKLNGIGEETTSSDVDNAVKNSDETPENGTTGGSAKLTE